jgi:2-oxoacid:acceptor oxidoreductase delta subunit (pyruvate/2-ketoisovalerate family)
MMRKPFAITLDVGSSRANHTGAWRTERPVYVSNLPPCNNACPAGENIQQWLYDAEEGGQAGYEAAWRQIMDDNPFPAVMGRVCYRPCETACNRAQLDSAVGINSVERFLGDEALRNSWQVPVAAAPTGEGGRGGGRGVLVVGAGPSGLSAAYHLTRLGHQVTIKDAGAEPGGMMRYGIPKYRLPREILDAEVNRILQLGVTLELGAQVTDLLAELGEGAGGRAAPGEGFDAAFVAVGAHIGRHAYIPAGDSARIMDAVSMLHSMEDGALPDSEGPMLGRRVAVYGGGNTAMDAARTARRLGASEAVVVYRRTRGQMPAHDTEVEEALDEGVTMRWLSTVAHADEGKLLIEKMKLDETGFPQPTGEFEELEADCLVLALGQNADLSVLADVPGVTFADHVVEVGPDLMTGHPGIFAGGDMVPAERTVTVAIGHGRQAAQSIDAYLRGGRATAPPRRRLAGAERLNTWYYADAPATVRPQLEAARRVTTFDEVTGGLDESTAVFEARRCMSCGNCFGCDNCYSVCPDNAIVKLADGQYEIDYEYCKGCGMCAAECPSGAIDMEPEQA